MKTDSLCVFSISKHTWEHYDTDQLLRKQNQILADSSPLRSIVNQKCKGGHLLSTLVLLLPEFDPRWNTVQKKMRGYYQVFHEWYIGNRLQEENEPLV